MHGLVSRRQDGGTAHQPAKRLLGMGARSEEGTTTHHPPAHRAARPHLGRARPGREPAGTTLTEQPFEPTKVNAASSRARLTVSPVNGASLVMNPSLCRRRCRSFLTARTCGSTCTCPAEPRPNRSPERYGCRLWRCARRRHSVHRAPDQTGTSQHPGGPPRQRLAAGPPGSGRPPSVAPNPAGPTLLPSHSYSATLT
jgi:hypothetical protein